MKIHYCETHYDACPPVDINPLILQHDPHGKFLVLVSREGMKMRINNMIKDPEYPYPFQEFDVFAWWDIDSKFNKDSKFFDEVICPELLGLYSAVVVIGKNRTDNIFIPIRDRVLDVIERY